ITELQICAISTDFQENYNHAQFFYKLLLLSKKFHYLCEKRIIHYAAGDYYMDIFIANHGGIRPGGGDRHDG
ncbi:MAG: hypothetical protein OSJ46_09650, partial [Duncaniella sp.]|nr:hypothetical protein [Duncaniella sp.]